MKKVTIILVLFFLIGGQPISHASDTQEKMGLPISVDIQLQTSKIKLDKNMPVNVMITAHSKEKEIEVWIEKVGDIWTSKTGKWEATLNEDNQYFFALETKVTNELALTKESASGFHVYVKTSEWEHFGSLYFFINSQGKIQSMGGDPKNYREITEKSYLCEQDPMPTQKKNIFFPFIEFFRILISRIF